MVTFLNTEEVLRLIELTQRKVVVERSDNFPFEIVKKVGGYSDDPLIATLQAKLSLLLEAARKSS
jgi:hypothetical protein